MTRRQIERARAAVNTALEEARAAREELRDSSLLHDLADLLRLQAATLLSALTPPSAATS